MKPKGHFEINWPLDNPILDLKRWENDITIKLMWKLEFAAIQSKCDFILSAFENWEFKHE